MSAPASTAKRKTEPGTVAIKWNRAFVIHFRGKANKIPLKPGVNLYTTEFLEEARKDPDFAFHLKEKNLVVLGGDAKSVAQNANSAPLSDDGVIEVIATLIDFDKLREIANDEKKSPRVREQADIRFKALVAEQERVRLEQESGSTGT